MLATPHLGYVTWETYEIYFGEAFAQVNAFAAGAPVGRRESCGARAPSCDRDQRPAAEPAPSASGG